LIKNRAIAGGWQVYFSSAPNRLIALHLAQPANHPKFPKIFRVDK
jgi:hypothetical protein